QQPGYPSILRIAALRSFGKALGHARTRQASLIDRARVRPVPIDPAADRLRMGASRRVGECKRTGVVVCALPLPLANVLTQEADGALQDGWITKQRREK